ncbi:uncharacterized protein PHALS_00494 [Plasmopara halstedii]|uniref:Uncharacterized protein n=1 Tax=Plasmopara halstedii TaxID=4781 RepID=A0A0P1A7K0_PLAHL|nr:uncharacterized protein PHALS_00494 [Plasmopara halstedii]CEG36170.1 hypothetical protein PHALS_00494 [Plasmopara halstedii]|eukprot:XP_024572539.1 hypothetical protein PHALS_00494 [Plasmopara halstedii]
MSFNMHWLLQLQRGGQSENKTLIQTTAPRYRLKYVLLELTATKKIHQPTMLDWKNEEGFRISQRELKTCVKSHEIST